MFATAWSARPAPRLRASGVNSVQSGSPGPPGIGTGVPPGVKTQTWRVVHAAEQDSNHQGLIDLHPLEPAPDPVLADVVDPLVPPPENRVDRRVELRHVPADSVVHLSMPVE